MIIILTIIVGQRRRARPLPYALNLLKRPTGRAWSRDPNGKNGGLYSRLRVERTAHFSFGSRPTASFCHNCENPFMFITVLRFLLFQFHVLGALLATERAAASPARFLLWWRLSGCFNCMNPLLNCWLWNCIVGRKDLGSIAALEASSVSDRRPVTRKKHSHAESE